MFLLQMLVAAPLCLGFLNTPVMNHRFSLKMSTPTETSPLPDLAATPVMNASPLVDRALDSALDFLQDAETNDEDAEDDEFDMFEIYEDSPELETPYDLIADLERKESEAAAGKLPATSVMNQAVIDAAVAKWRKHEKDVGSAEVQVVIAHEKIKYITKHLLANKKDVAAKRGLQAYVVQRRKFLNYIYNENREKCMMMIADMNIRFRPAGQMWDKATKYAAYKNTKTKFNKGKALKENVRVVNN
jgi:small subunit ribosomal protein S15